MATDETSIENELPKAASAAHFENPKNHGPLPSDFTASARNGQLEYTDPTTKFTSLDHPLKNPTSQFAPEQPRFKVKVVGVSHPFTYVGGDWTWTPFVARSSTYRTRSTQLQDADSFPGEGKELVGKNLQCT